MKNTTLDLAVQSPLYNEHVLPNEGELLQTLSEVRGRVDAQFLRDYSDVPAVSLPWYRSIRKYPHGFCDLITHKVLSALEAESPPFLAAFRSDGGYVNQHFGIFSKPDGSKMFHHTIQIGTRICDVVAEEWSGGLEKIRIAKLNDPRYAVVSTIAEYREIKERYHKDAVYATSGLFRPEISMLAPMVFVDWLGQIELGGSSCVLLDIQTKGLWQARDFLVRSKEAELPAIVRKRFVAAVAAHSRHMMEHEADEYSRVQYAMDWNGRRVSHKMARDSTVLIHARVREIAASLSCDERSVLHNLILSYVSAFSGVTRKYNQMLALGEFEKMGL